MDIKYWNKLADKYEDEVMSSFHSDKNRVIEKEIKRHASKGAVACDFGCGIGHYSPMLSKSFRQVHSYDLSPELIDKAVSRHKKLKNVTFTPADLTDMQMKFPDFKFAVCANVLICDNYEIRKEVISNIASAMKKGSKILFVIPSLESALYVNYRMFEWNMKDGYTHEKAYAEGMKHIHPKEGSIIDGLVSIDGVSTKHYLKEEIISWFAYMGLKVLKTEKVEYTWDTEFEDPPKWMKEPYPWDWMVVAGK